MSIVDILTDKKIQNDSAVEVDGREFESEVENSDGGVGLCFPEKPMIY